MSSCDALAANASSGVAAALRAVDFVIAALQQFLNDVLNVFTHVARLSQGGGISHHKGDVQGTRKRLGQQRFT